MTSNGKPPILTREIKFGDLTFTVSTAHPEDTYFEHVQSALLPPAVHVAAALCDPSSVIIDVGANIGLCSLAFSRIVPSGHVVSFEPGERAFEDLLRSISLNIMLNIEPHRMALGSRNEEVTLLQPKWNTAGSFISNSNSPACGLHASNSRVENTSVIVRTLDSMVEELNIRKIDFIKIDVEGYETAVLDGAGRTLEAFRPPTLVELNVFTLSVFANQNPLSFVLDLVHRFPYVLAINNTLERQAVTDVESAYHLIHRCFVSGEVFDLLCSWSPLEDELAAAWSREP